MVASPSVIQIAWRPRKADGGATPGRLRVADQTMSSPSTLMAPAAPTSMLSVPGGSHEGAGVHCEGRSTGPGHERFDHLPDDGGSNHRPESRLLDDGHHDEA